MATSSNLDRIIDEPRVRPDLLQPPAGPTRIEIEAVGTVENRNCLLPNGSVETRDGRLHKLGGEAGLAGR